jgi:hypothetical protein
MEIALGAKIVPLICGQDDGVPDRARCRRPIDPNDKTDGISHGLSRYRNRFEKGKLDVPGQSPQDCFRRLNLTAFAYFASLTLTRPISTRKRDGSFCHPR